MKKGAIAFVVIVAALVAVAVLVRSGDGTGSRSGRPAPPAPGTAPVPEATAPGRPGPAVTGRALSAAPGPESSTPRDGEQEAPFSFDDRKPLIDQVRPILKFVEVPDAQVLRACRERKDEVAAAVAALLGSGTLSSNEREMALVMLGDLKVPATFPVVLELARRDPDEDVRADAIRTLGAFPGKVDSGLVRELFGAARSVTERIEAVELLGNLGDAEALPFLEETARSYPDTTVLEVARQAAAKVRILSSPDRDVKLVQHLYREESPLRDWALSRIVAGKNRDMVPHLKEVLAAHRKQPEGKALPYFVHDLLAALKEFGEPLSPEDEALLRKSERSP